MAQITSDMPPLLTAEALDGVPNQTSTQPLTGNVTGGTVDSTQTNENDNTNNNNSTPPSSSTNQTSNNNTISAAADSSDNQPSTPQPQLINSNSTTETSQQQHTTQNSSGPLAHHPYGHPHIYQPNTTSQNSSQLSNQMYNQHIYSSAGLDMPQSAPLTSNQQNNSSYPSYLNSYEQFYQQQQQQQQQNAQMVYINSNSSSLYPQTDYKLQQPQQTSGVRYHPYLHNPTSVINSQNPQNALNNASNNNALDANSQTAPVVSSASSSSLMSPRVVSSTSPSSTSNQMPLTGGSTSSIGSPNAGTPQCKKCGIMCTNDTELQEHITNAHGASPYGSSGYASSPYIKEELQQQTPPSQQQASVQQPNTATVSNNASDLLDLDAQKMLYPPPAAINMNNNMMQNQPLGSIPADPLHGLHNMQQRAGLSTWDQQQTQDGLTPYLHQQQPLQTSTFPSPKQSPYHVSNSSNIMKTDYPLIKSEYSGTDTQQSPYIADKSFDPTAAGNQQQLMPPAVPSSPAEFPSTTTDGSQDNSQSGQQYRSANFEPPSSSSTALTTGPINSKAANWKSNEARRPKTYNCTACNKWFTSSGHLKRHYNTTLHKNAVKSSGQPDPATLPISTHHHPSRDPNAKSGRRGAAAAAVNNSQRNRAQQQQQTPNPVQPPEPPNSPQDYGGAPQMAAGGLAPLSHYAATPSPNSIYQQQQQHYQHQQYMPQVQSTTNASPQHHYQQQQTVINGHPNALAGLSVPTTQAQQQMPMPSSQMRGLLTNTSQITLTTSSTMRIVKNEHMEAAISVSTPSQQQLQRHITPVLDQKSEREEEEIVQDLKYHTKREVKREASETLTTSPPIMYTVKEELEDQQEEERLPPQQVVAASAVVLKEADHHPNTFLIHQHQQFEAVEHQQQHLERHFHSSTHSPLIISQQQYQEQLQHKHKQMVELDTYTHPPQQDNIMEHQQSYISMPLDINTMQQQPSNMLQLQPPDTTIHTTHTLTNTVNMLAPSQHTQQPQQQQLTELQPLVNTQLQPLQQLDTINTSTPHMQQPSLSTTTTSNITSIPSFHQLQQPASVLQPLEHTLTYPHTIIGNAEVLTLDEYGNVMPSIGQHQQVIQTADGQYVQFLSTADTQGATALYTAQAYNSYTAQMSPQEGDLPPLTSQNFYPEENTTLTLMTSAMTNLYEYNSQCNSNFEMDYRSSLSENFVNTENCNSNNSSCDFQTESQTTSMMTSLKKPQQQERPMSTSGPITSNTTTSTSSTKTSSNKRKRNPSTSSPMNVNSTVMPSGRIKCIPCNKEFTKICYLTQHNKSFHSGEYPFRCEKCGKRFQTEDVYATHLNKHQSNDKDHKCNLCPKQFHHKTDLRRHIEGIHTGNKQHVCDICSKSFCRKDHLRKHLETHNKPRTVSKKLSAATKPPRNVPKKSNDFTQTLQTQEIKQETQLLPSLPLSSPLPPSNIFDQASTSKASMQQNETPTTNTFVSIPALNEKNLLTASALTTPTAAILLKFNETAAVKYEESADYEHMLLNLSQYGKRLTRSELRRLQKYVYNGYIYQMFKNQNLTSFKSFGQGTE